MYSTKVKKVTINLTEAKWANLRIISDAEGLTLQEALEGLIDVYINENIEEFSGTLSN